MAVAPLTCCDNIAGGAAWDEQVHAPWHPSSLVLPCGAGAFLRFQPRAGMLWCECWLSTALGDLLLAVANPEFLILAIAMLTELRQRRWWGGLHSHAVRRHECRTCPTAPIHLALLCRALHERAQCHPGYGPYCCRLSTALVRLVPGRPEKSCHVQPHPPGTWWAST